MDLRVADLIDFENGVWDLSVLREICSEEEQKLILQLPLSTNFRKDSMYWWPTKNGVFSVKSAYWLCRRGFIASGVMSSTQIDNSLWSLCWGLDGPPKLRHFLWRAVHGNLAVKERLFYRHIVIENSCPVCHSEEESIIHTLFECSAAKNIWAHSKFKEIVRDAPSETFIQRFLWLSKKVSKVDFCSIATLLWAAWAYRNKVVYEQVPVNPVMIATGFTKLVSEYRVYAKRVLAPPNLRRMISAQRWTLPPMGMVKINCDAHVKEGCQGGLGVVIRDAKEVEGIGVSIAEAKAVMFGLKIAQRLGLEKVRVESDDLGLVNAIKQKSKGFTPVNLIYDDICNLSLTFDSFDMAHVRRAGNILAHTVARWDTRGSDEFVCLGSFPQSLIVLADLDLP